MAKSTVPAPATLPDDIAEAVARLRASSPPVDDLTAAALALLLDYVDPPAKS